MGVLDVLRKMHDNDRLPIIPIGCFIPGSLTEPSSMGFTMMCVIWVDQDSGDKNPLLCPQNPHMCLECRSKCLEPDTSVAHVP